MAKTQVTGASIQDGTVNPEDLSESVAADLAAGAAAGATADAAAAAAASAEAAADAATTTANDAATTAATAQSTADAAAAAAQSEAEQNDDQEGRIAALEGIGTIVEGEVPSGAIDGSNTAFTLANSAAAHPTSLKVWRDGLRVALTDDYTFDGTTGITFLDAPQNHVIVDYRY